MVGKKYLVCYRAYSRPLVGDLIFGFEPIAVDSEITVFFNKPKFFIRQQCDDIKKRTSKKSGKHLVVSRHKQSDLSGFQLSMWNNDENLP